MPTAHHPSYPLVGNVPPRASKESVRRRPVSSFSPPSPTTQDLVLVRQGRGWRLWIVLVLVFTVSFLILKVQVFDPWWQGVQNQIHFGDSKLAYGAFSLTGDTVPSNIVAFVRTDPKSGGAYLIVLDARAGKQPMQFVKPLMGHVTNQTIVLLSLSDSNGDGRSDVVLGFQESPVTFVLLNTGKGDLTWATP